MLLKSPLNVEITRCGCGGGLFPALIADKFSAYLVHNIPLPQRHMRPKHFFVEEFHFTAKIFCSRDSRCWGFLSTPSKLSCCMQALLFSDKSVGKLFPGRN